MNVLPWIVIDEISLAYIAPPISALLPLNSQFTTVSVQTVAEVTNRRVPNQYRKGAVDQK